MNFHQWLKQSGLTMYALARICNLSRGTIKNLNDGKRPNVKTVKKLILMTRSMKKPISFATFGKVRGRQKLKRDNK